MANIPASAGPSAASAPLGTPQNFPVGPAARRQLRRLLLSSKDPPSTVQTFQRTHSLHSFLARSFGTTPTHELHSERHAKATRESQVAKSKEEVQGLKSEPFRPDPSLTFLGHLGVRRAEVHRRVADSLRVALVDEIGRSSTSDGPAHDALLGLLKSSWQYAAVPELRPVLSCLVRRLGERTPTQVLERLADRDPKGAGGWKHAEILAQFGQPMRRLVYESDWAARVSVGEGTFQTAAALSELIRPAAEAYCQDESLREAANLPFVGTVRERRMATTGRRTAGAGSSAAAGSASSSGGTISGALASITGAAAASGATSSKKDAGKSDPSSSETGGMASGDAVARIKDVVGKRPKLLGAVLCMLIAEHGRHVETASAEDGGDVQTVLGGAQFLSCTLTSDVLLSYGQLPRQFEHLGLLARILDNSVRLGIITDDVVAQVQGCLRAIFQSPQGQGNDKDKEKEKDKGDEDEAPEVNSDKKRKGDTIDKDDKKAKKNTIAVAATPTKRDDTEFQLKLLRKVISAAIAALRQSDLQGLFLNPVTDAIAPGYSTLIKDPICLRNMEEKAEKGNYQNLPDFEHHVQLMYQNCITYNIGKEGQWFRGEARRQGKVWAKDIMPQARALFKREMTKRKKALEKSEQMKKGKAAATLKEGTQEKKVEANSEKKKRKREDAPSKDQKNSRTEKIQKVFSGSSLVKKNDAAISRLTAKDIDPLPPSKSKRRKKDGDCSLPALAAILLSDPFVVRLVVERILRSLRSDVLGEKTLPVGHKAVPSLLQLLHFAQFSTQLCAIRGKRYFVPDEGLTPVRDEEGADGEQALAAPGSREPVASLRKYSPLLAGLLLESILDRRMAAGGDLHDAASSNVISSLPEMDIARWQTGPSQPVSLGTVPRALVEGALVHLVQLGNSNDAALRVQFPRFARALTALSGDEMLKERPFFLSFIRALLRHKSKLSHGTRDVVVEAWVGWIGGRGEKTRRSSMVAPVHECFMMLLNEWSSLGNVLLPRDTMLKFAEDAVVAAESSCDGEDKKKILAVWWAMKCNNTFTPIKQQYIKMLESVPETQATQWKEKVGVDDASLAALPEEAEASAPKKEGTTVEM